MAYRLEVRSLRTGAWIPLDEERGVVGRRMPSRAQYERRARRRFPIIRGREWRVVEFDAPRARELFTLTISLRG